MTSESDERHSKQVDAWIATHAGELPSEKLLLLFGEAVRAIRKRAAVTLSEVTLDAIFGRVLYTSQKKFPLLSKLKNESTGLDDLLAHAEDIDRDEIQEAFRFFLVNLLTILGNLTADILTKPLYQELFKVTAGHARSSSKAGHRGLRSVKRSSDQGDM